MISTGTAVELGLYLKSSGTENCLLIKSQDSIELSSLTSVSFCASDCFYLKEAELRGLSDSKGLATGSLTTLGSIVWLEARRETGFESFWT